MKDLDLVPRKQCLWLSLGRLSPNTHYYMLNSRAITSYFCFLLFSFAGLSISRLFDVALPFSSPASTQYPLS